MPDERDSLTADGGENPASLVSEVIRGVQATRSGLNRRLALDGYEVFREIARGGQAVVYLARRLADGEPVAIKVIPDHGDGSAIRRLQAEAKILRRLDHPNVVACHDIIRADALCYLVMNYVPGVPLSVLLEELSRRRTSSKSLANMLRMLACVCRALDAAHQAGVTHRDIKPPNIRVDDDGKPYLLDFGLASVADDSASLRSMHTVVDRGHFVGTLFWASPEQFRGESATPASDLWSIGLILQQILTANASPYTNERGLAAAIGQAAEGRVQIPEPLIPAVAELGPASEPAALALLKSLLAPRPQDRPASAGDVADRLDRLADGQTAPGDAFVQKPRRRLVKPILSVAGLIAATASAWWMLSGTPEAGVLPSETAPPGEVRVVGGFYEVRLGAGLIFRWIPTGTVSLGTDLTRPRVWTPLAGDSPLRPYRQQEGFWMSRFEVHQAAYEAVVGTNPSHHRGPALPVEQVSYDEALEFCSLASERFGVPIRLPTPSEWEYACRAGSETIYSFGDDPLLAARYANAADASYRDAPDPAAYNDGFPKTAPRGSFLHNAFGLSDMHGNVWEWCQGPYEAIPEDPTSAVSGMAEVRGGSYYDASRAMESAHRNPLSVDSRATTVGFRVVADFPPPE